jgi:hypothetical protein
MDQRYPHPPTPEKCANRDHQRNDTRIFRVVGRQVPIDEAALAVSLTGQ